jgi:hypothetical protein
MTIEVPDWLEKPLEMLIQKYASRYDSEALCRENVLRGVIALGIIGMVQADARTPDVGERVQ